jgi:hypothetical protein
MDQLLPKFKNTEPFKAWQLSKQDSQEEDTDIADREDLSVLIDRIKHPVHGMKNILFGNLPKGFEIRQRKFMGKLYDDCFLASEAVDWIILNTDIKDREEAVKTCQQLFKDGVFSVVASLKPVRQFADDDNILMVIEDNVKEPVMSMQELSENMEIPAFNRSIAMKIKSLVDKCFENVE